MENSLVSVKGVSKFFGGIKALESVDLFVERDAITGLIGPNGAGKTTLFNIIAGTYSATEGSVLLDGVCIDGYPVHKRVEMGIARTFQITRPFKGMKVIDNIMVGAHPWTVKNRVKSFFLSGLNLRYLRDQEIESYEYALQMMKLAGIEDLKDEVAGNISHGQRRLLEMARAMATRPKVLLLDEPGAGLNPHEVDMLVAALRSIAVETGTAVFLVEHNMRLVMNACKYMYVLDFGRKIAEGIPEGISKNKRVLEAYLGKES